MEKNPERVPEGAKQTGEVRARWAWTEPAVWTERMLTALETGVKGGRWYSLMDKVYAERTLEASFERVRANGGAPGVDHVTIEQFAECLGEEIPRVAKALREGSYHPQAIRRRWAEKLGRKEKRPLGIPTVRDRTVQAAVVAAMEPIFEREFAPQSYGFRPGRGCKDALRRVQNLLNAGYVHVVDADLKGYFDNIPHDRLMERVRTKIADSKVLRLVKMFLKAKVMDTAASWTPEEGTPQGAVLSPLLSNIYLDPLDHLMAEQGYEMVRYADDFVILCRSKAEAQQALEEVGEWVEAERLTLHPEKTRIVDANGPEGIDFLGYHFVAGKRWPRRKSVKKLKDTIRAKTRRTNGHSLEATIQDVNRTLIGWFEYFKHSRKYTFTRLDQWIRMRLRSILRKRRNRRGRGRGSDHQRWPNAFFASHGLFSLLEAHERARQSSRR